jgi:hypothetical protein
MPGGSGPKAHVLAERRPCAPKAIVDSVTATSDGIDRLEPCKGLAPYVLAAIPGHWVPTERKTGLEPAVRALRTIRVRDGGLDLLRRAA